MIKNGYKLNIVIFQCLKNGLFAAAEGQVTVFWSTSFCLISNREGLGANLEIMGLGTIDSHSQKEQTEHHKILKFHVDQ